MCIRDSNDTVIIGDFKTSNQPYCRYYPTGKDNRSLFTGWNKFNKCAMQLAAYAQACKETLGVNVSCAEIIVSTPEIDQSFILNANELNKFQTKWLQKVRRYQEIKEEEKEAKHILKELKESEDARNHLTSSDVSSDASNKADHCKATV